MKIWVDDIRQAPEGYIWCKSVKQAKDIIELLESCLEVVIPSQSDKCIEVIDLDHDAGRYAEEGGDYIKILDWLEETGRNYPIHIHSMNVVGVENMRRIIQKNGWKEV